MKPSGRALPSATSDESSPFADDPLTQWRILVQKALQDKDQITLRNLFTQLSTLVPADRISHEWLHAVSAWDANAKTG